MNRKNRKNAGIGIAAALLGLATASAGCDAPPSDAPPSKDKAAATSSAGLAPAAPAAPSSTPAAAEEA